MEKYNKNSIDTLADIFILWQENQQLQHPETNFLQQSGLADLISADDLHQLQIGRACFSTEASRAIYALLPIKLKLKDISLAVFPQSFHRLNYRAQKSPHTRILNISFHLCEQIYQKHTPAKEKFLTENKNKLRYENQKAKDPQMSQRAYLRSKENMSEEKKEILREQSRLRMRLYRQKNPESIKLAHQKAKARFAALPLAEQICQKIDTRLRNKKYRETHREEIAEKRKLYNPTPEQQKKYNQSQSHKQAVKTYYQKHKEEIAQKAKDNPQTKVYKQRYKIKKRFQEKTGALVLSLLQALAEAKSR